MYINNVFFSATDVNMRLFVNNTCLSFQHSDSDYVHNVIGKVLNNVDE